MSTKTRTCGHEASQGGVRYACERPPHPVDGYGPKFRHAAGIDAGYAERTDPGDQRGQADLVTWGEDESGGDQEWELAWGTVASYDEMAAAMAREDGPDVTFPADSSPAPPLNDWEW